VTTTRARLARISATAAVAALALLGCGGDDTSSSGGAASDGEAPTSQAPGDPAGATGAEWPDDHCGIVAEELIGAEVGEAVTAEDFPPVGCQYLGDSNGVVIEYYSIAAECEGAESRTDDPEVVDGLGVHAAFVSANIDEALAVTLDNGLCFFVHGTYSGDVDSDAARIAIAKHVLAAS
jgi:hypothetical protein